MSKQSSHSKNILPLEIWNTLSHQQLLCHLKYVCSYPIKGIVYLLTFFRVQKVEIVGKVQFLCGFVHTLQWGPRLFWNSVTIIVWTKMFFFCGFMKILLESANDEKIWRLCFCHSLHSKPFCLVHRILCWGVLTLGFCTFMVRLKG